MPANPLPCGCGIMGTRELDHGEARERFSGLFIHFCPLHSAAGEMLATLTDIETETTRNWRHYSKWFVIATLDHVRRLARAAIARAEKGEVKA